MLSGSKLFEITTAENKEESFALQRYNAMAKGKKLTKSGYRLACATPFAGSFFDCINTGRVIMGDYLSSYFNLKSQSPTNSEPKTVLLNNEDFPHKNVLNELQSRACGVMLFSAVGDALGAPFEFLQRVCPDESTNFFNGRKLPINDEKYNDNWYLYLKYANGAECPVVGSEPKFEETHQIVLFPMNVDELEKGINTFNPKHMDKSEPRFMNRMRDHNLPAQSGMIGAAVTSNRIPLGKVCAYYTDDFAQAICLADTLIISGSKNCTEFKSREFATCVYDWWTQGYAVPYIKLLDKKELSALTNKNKNTEKQVDELNKYIQIVFKNNGTELYQGFGLGGNTKLFINNVKKILQEANDEKKTRADANVVDYVLPDTISNKQVSGNGSLMRSAPLCALAVGTLAFETAKENQSQWMNKILQVAMKQSFVTHGGYAAAQCCAVLAFIAQNVARATIEIEKDENNKNKTQSELFGLYHEAKQHILNSEEFWNTCKTEIQRAWKQVYTDLKLRDPDVEEGVIPSLCGDVLKLFKSSGEFNWRLEGNKLARYEQQRWTKDPYYIGSYVCDALHMALNAFYRNKTPYSVMVDACCRGGDADSVGAIAGSLCGACYGVWALPPNWVVAIGAYERKMGEIVARGLYLSEIDKKK